MFNVTICWDKIEQTKILSKYLAKFSIDKDFKYNLTTCNSLDKLLLNHPKHIDILFLYIELTDKNTATATYKKLQSIYSDIKIIFIPEILNFMLNGFALKDFHYLLQPLSYESFEDEMSSCTGTLNTTTDETYVNLLNGVFAKTILYIEDKGNECVAYTNNSMFQIPHDLNHIEKLLTSSFMFRCHKNYIINLKNLSRIGKYFVIIKSREIPVDSNKFGDLKHKLLIILNLL